MWSSVGCVLFLHDCECVSICNVHVCPDALGIALRTRNITRSKPTAKSAGAFSGANLLWLRKRRRLLTGYEKLALQGDPLEEAVKLTPNHSELQRQQLASDMMNGFTLVANLMVDCCCVDCGCMIMPMTSVARPYGGL